ncbi:MAG: hypothetical protein ACK56I_24620, partial [bacterium]
GIDGFAVGLTACESACVWRMSTGLAGTPAVCAAIWRCISLVSIASPYLEASEFKNFRGPIL